MQQLKGAYRMTGQEALTRYVKVFGGHLPDFDGDYWDKLSNGTKWMQDKFPDSDYSLLCEKYLRACLEIASIEEIIRKDIKI